MTDIETIRALNIGSRGGQAIHKVRYGPCFRYGGRVVICGRPNKPYGTSMQTRAYLSHIPTAIYTAWMKGRVVGHMARWRCGGQSRSFTLSLEPLYRLCHLCALYTGARQTHVTVTVWGAE